MGETFLDQIFAATRADLEDRKARVSLDELRERAASAPAPRPIFPALRTGWAGPAALIAEVKRASPSKGLIAERFDPVAQAQAYQAGGARVVSVLTEPRFFQGALDHLAAVRAAVALPVLRKDFIFDPYQLYEARAAGADAILLICSLLDEDLLRELLGLARSLGMEALVEAHDAGEVRRAVASDAKVIGVNARDLRSFVVDTEIVRHLRPLVPNDRIFVAESGITGAPGAARARAWGADAILVGEALMRASDPAAKTHELATAPGGGYINAFFRRTHRPFVKLCGLTTPEQLRLAAELGADACGLVFAPQAPAHRRLTPDAARDLTEKGRDVSETGSPLPAGEGEGGEDSPQMRPLARRARPGEPQTVGVFVNEDPTEIARVVEHVGLDAIQLSGDETPEQCAQVAELTQRTVIKAVRPRSESDLDALDAYALAGAVLLVDTPKAGSYGGTGETGDWALAAAIAKRWPILLSGGLTPENVADAIRAVQPRGVDVSSGVETDLAKDPVKIARFVAAARAANIHGGP
jgi:indole-3-glycerol phosphate synthase/phosphoribosylanthranilate isomerase